MAKSPIEETIKASIWKTPPVADQPMILLVRWRVLEVRNAELEVERHLVGYNVLQREGRVSTAIEHFDPTSRTAITHSGRLYQLVGQPGYDPDGAWVWGYWSKANRMTDERDVTEEIWELCGGARK